MRRVKHLWLGLLVLGAVAVPAVSPADPIETEPLGHLVMTNVVSPSGTTPGTAKLTIQTPANLARRYFGLRIMGTEDVEMASFSVENAGCIVSDFAGTGTAGWQGGAAFAASAGPAGSANSHMRMIGGYLQGSCGDVFITIRFRALPLVVYYATFFGSRPAPWNNNYGTAPWNVVPTGGTASYQQWWNLWGQFDTLGYSNACTFKPGDSPSNPPC